ncbi:trypsin-like serine peptidase [Marinobacter nauticus]|uniref:hypothetical protein n=1 Tax=Marinobacter nauticus TaxID=2743 RepID=UPI001CFCF8AE|nr:hypothetical protein [Marinobacter nauticus]
MKSLTILSILTIILFQPGVLIAMEKEIEKNSWENRAKTYMRASSETLIDTTNQAPQVGRLSLENKGLDFGHGSGFFIDMGDGQRDKILTAAHNFFDEDGALRAPLSAWRFERGFNVDDEKTEVFGLQKIKCATSNPYSDDDINDQCLVTLDRELTDEKIELIKIWSGNHGKIPHETTTFFIGYQGYSERSSTKRTLNRCSLIRFDKLDKITLTNCNSSKGMSGGLHGVPVNGKLQAIGVIKGARFDADTGRLGGTFSVPILEKYNRDLMITIPKDIN